MTPPGLRQRIGLLLLALLAAELSAFLCLQALEQLSARGVVRSHLEYDPLDRLSDRHAEILARMLAGEPSHRRISSSLGWTPAENNTTDLYEINSAGIRGRREYGFEVPPGITRMLTFGDSFTFGDEVGNESTWQNQLERNSRAFEVLNFGVGGYGLDQAYLRYQELGTAFEADIVAIGFLPDDSFRNVNRFKPFYFRRTGIPLGKPRFRLEGDDLVRVENPFPDESSYQQLLDRPRETLAQAGIGDAYYEAGPRASPLDVSATVRLAKLTASVLQRRSTRHRVLFGRGDDRPEAFRVTTQLFEAFYSEVERNGDVPVILLFPSWDDLRRRWDGRDVSYATLMAHLDEAGLRHLDLAPAFDRSEERFVRGDLFGSGHYSPLGNRLVARYLQAELARLVPGVATFLASE